MSIEVFFHGCLGQPGHYIHTKKTELDYPAIPWRHKLDSGLLTDNYYGADTTPNGLTTFVTLDGWSALAFWDRSGDGRPGSNSVFFCHALVSPEELLGLAREQWPSVFDRPRFPVLRLPQPA